MITEEAKQRLNLVSSFFDIIKAFKTKSTKPLEKIKDFIPTHLINIEYVPEGISQVRYPTRLMSIVNKKQKGKKRVYASHVRNYDDIFMRYISKHEVDKLDHKCGYQSEWLKDIIGNRWIITVDDYEFRNSQHLVSKILAIETTPHKGNHPPAGGDTVWKSMNSLIPELSKFRSSSFVHTVFRVSVEEFSMHMED